MPTYAALIYSKDVDWTLPEYATETNDYTEFGEAAAAVIRGGFLSGASWQLVGRFPAGCTSMDGAYC